MIDGQAVRSTTPTLISMKQHKVALFKISESICFLLWHRVLDIPERSGRRKSITTVGRGLYCMVVGDMAPRRDHNITHTSLAGPMTTLPKRERVNMHDRIGISNVLKWVFQSGVPNSKAVHSLRRPGVHSAPSSTKLRAYKCHLLPGWPCLLLIGSTHTPPRRTSLSQKVVITPSWLA